MASILHLIPRLNTGGSQWMLHNLLAASEDRHRQEVVSLVDVGVVGKRIRAQGVQVHALGMDPQRPDPQAVWRLIRVLRRRRPDILVTWLHQADLVGLVAGRLGRVRRICWNLRVDRLDRTDSTLRWLLRVGAWLSPWVDAVISNSAAGIEAHRALGYRPPRWKLIGNGFDTERFRPDPTAAIRFRRTLELAPDTPLIGCFARFDPQKDHPTLFTAFRQVRASRPTARLVLAGRGTDNPRLISLAREAGIAASVIPLGERLDMPELMAAMDIVTLASRSEGVPNALGEAMASGVPTVATAAGDTAELIGETGRIVPVGDAEALGKAISELLSLNREDRRNLEKAARRRVETRFSITSVARRYLDFYDSILEPGAQSVPHSSNHA